MELYYAPLACSLAARIVAREAGVPLTLHHVAIFDKILVDGGGDYGAVAPLGMVPLLRLDDGSELTEMAAVLTYLADRAPASGLAPPPASFARYRLAELLSLIATELHKKVLWPLFNRGVPDEVRAHARAAAPRIFDHLATRLAGRAFLLGEQFTAADAYLTWALHLADLARLGPGHGRPALADYLARQRARPVVAELLADETPRASRP